MTRQAGLDAEAVPLPLDDLTRRLGAAKTRGPAPVELWNPPFCGDIGLKIARDGTWFYGGTPIQRPALVILFASILRKDPGRYVLVTPVECVGIIVEDVPFIATAMARRENSFVLTTNLGDEASAGPDHPLRFEFGDDGGVKPYVHIRGGLWARFTRALALELIDLAVTRETGGREALGIESGGQFFPIEPASESQAPAGTERREPAGLDRHEPAGTGHTNTMTGLP